MSESMIQSLTETVSGDPSLQARFRAAATVEELRSAVTAAGFDPEHPDIAAGLATWDELDDDQLETTTGGIGSVVVHFDEDW